MLLHYLLVYVLDVEYALLLHYLLVYVLDVEYALQY